MTGGFEAAAIFPSLARSDQQRRPFLAMASPGQTPSGSSSPFFSYTPKGSKIYMGRSFENLVALANHQERLKEARKMVWRDRGEPVTELNDVWECLEHAARGALRESAKLLFL
jgi:hypothetical protein